MPDLVKTNWGKGWNYIIEGSSSKNSKNLKSHFFKYKSLCNLKLKMW